MRAKNKSHGFTIEQASNLATGLHITTPIADKSCWISVSFFNHYVTVHDTNPRPSCIWIEPANKWNLDMLKSDDQSFHFRNSGRSISLLRLLDFFIKPCSRYFVYCEVQLQIQRTCTLSSFWSSVYLSLIAVQSRLQYHIVCILHGKPDSWKKRWFSSWP